MGRSRGAVRFEDGLILFTYYQNTSDVMHAALVKSWEEAKSPRKCNKCTCGRAEDVQIATTYAGGSWWKGTACRYCMVIVEGWVTFAEYDFGKTIINIEEYDGLPYWWPEE